MTMSGRRHRMFGNRDAAHEASSQTGPHASRKHSDRYHEAILCAYMCEQNQRNIRFDSLLALRTNSKEEAK